MNVPTALTRTLFPDCGVGVVAVALRSGGTCLVVVVVVETSSTTCDPSGNIRRTLAVLTCVVVTVLDPSPFVSSTTYSLMRDPSGRFVWLVDDFFLLAEDDITAA
jgi:hypothetical protein